MLSRIIALSFIFQVCLSWPLWSLVDRTYPQLLLFDGFYLPFHLGGLLQGSVLLLLLGGIFFFPEKKWPNRLLLMWLFLLIALDVNRLQVWVWFYGLFYMLNSTSNLVNSDFTRLLLAAVYCWSGFNKLNPYFVEEQFPWFCGAFRSLQPFGQG